MTGDDTRNDAGKPKRLARRAIYQSEWVNLFVDRVQFAQGRIIDEHHVLEFDKMAVAALVVDDEGRLLLIESYRYVTDSIDWEIPAGRIEAQEDVLLAAQREVLEETGFTTYSPRQVYIYHPMHGVADMVHHIVACRAGQSCGDFDSNEVRSWRWHTASQVEEMIRTGKIRDGYTLTALLLHLHQMV